MACGRLHGPKAEAIPGAGDGHAQHVAVLVDCGDHVTLLRGPARKRGMPGLEGVELELVGGPVEPDHQPCWKPEEVMGWDQWQKVSVLLLMALWDEVGGWVGRPQGRGRASAGGHGGHGDHGENRGHGHG